MYGSITVLGKDLQLFVCVECSEADQAAVYMCTVEVAQAVMVGLRCALVGCTLGQ